MNLIDSNSIFSKVTNLYRNASGEARIAYRTVLDMICEEYDVPDIDRAVILRLCNEIEDIATEIGNYGELYKTVVAARHICDRAKAIGKELTGDAGTD